MGQNKSDCNLLHLAVSYILNTEAVGTVQYFEDCERVVWSIALKYNGSVSDQLVAITWRIYTILRMHVLSLQLAVMLCGLFYVIPCHQTSSRYSRLTFNWSSFKELTN